MFNALWTVFVLFPERLGETEVELVELRIAMETKRQREAAQESSEGEDPIPAVFSHSCILLFS